MSSFDVPLNGPEYDNVEEELNHADREERNHIEQEVDAEEDTQRDDAGGYADDGADDAEAENIADYDEAAAWRDDGYASAAPSPPDHEDSDWWNTYVDIETLQRTTAQEYGAFIGGGEVLGWRGNNTGKSVIVGYKYDGKIIGRLEAAARRWVDTSEGGHAHISATCRGKKKIGESDNYWSQQHVRGMGIVAWRVEPEYTDDPTSVLIPMNKAWYPETYVGVIWCDETYTWESRDCLRFIMGSRNYDTDVTIYSLATSQDGDYQEALSGIRPEYPRPGERSNKHWRNVNSFQGAYWKQPRAKKESRVVRVEEIPVNEEDDMNADEEVYDEEADADEGNEGEEFDDAEDVIQEDQDNYESRVQWQASGRDGYGEAPPPYITPAASREGSAIPDGSRRRRLSPINEDEEFHTPYTPNAFNDRYRSRSSRVVDGSQQGTPVRGSRTASGFRENTPSRPPSVTPMRGSRGALRSQRGTPRRPPSESTQGSTPSRPPSGSQRGTPNEPPSGSRGNTPRQPTSGSRRGTPSQLPSGSRGSTPSQDEEFYTAHGSQQSASVRGSRAASGSRVNTPRRPPSVTPMQGSGGASGSHRGTPSRPPSERGSRAASGSQVNTPSRPPSVTPMQGSGGASGSQQATPTQRQSGSQRVTPSRPPSGSQGSTPRAMPNEPASRSQGDTPRQLTSGSQRGTPVRGNQLPSGQGNRRRPTSAQSSSEPVAQPRATQNRSSDRTGNGRRGQRQNPHRQARRHNIRQ